MTTTPLDIHYSDDIVISLGNLKVDTFKFVPQNS